MDMNMQESEMEKDKCVSEIIQNGTNKRLTLEKSLTTLQSQLESSQSELNSILPKLQNDPTVTVKRHIHLLHTYNDIKDIALGLMTLLAESRGERLVDVQKSFGIAEAD
ncbi:hypothetical protein PENSTE_c001G01936 [Penicillium steckii]|uniref:Swi5-domain-containing protein n=1 Tax=Penicillium steckii TaxID=303698 RepID=A0A1V6U184_9EURO|nr:hypothetical protein PENSTE_c001G01936 [Penicillium steckii]